MFGDTSSTHTWCRCGNNGWGYPFSSSSKKEGLPAQALERDRLRRAVIFSIYVDCSVEGRHALRTVSSPDGARIQENNAQIK